MSLFASAVRVLPLYQQMIPYSETAERLRVFASVTACIPPGCALRVSMAMFNVLLGRALVFRREHAFFDAVDTVATRFAASSSPDFGRGRMYSVIQVRDEDDAAVSRLGPLLDARGVARVRESDDEFSLNNSNNTVWFLTKFELVSLILSLFYDRSLVNADDAAKSPPFSLLPFYECFTSPFVTPCVGDIDYRRRVLATSPIFNAALIPSRSSSSSSLAYDATHATLVVISVVNLVARHDSLRNHRRDSGGNVPFHCFTGLVKLVLSHLCERRTHPLVTPSDFRTSLDTRFRDEVERSDDLKDILSMFANFEHRLHKLLLSNAGDNPKLRSPFDVLFLNYDLPRIQTIINNGLRSAFSAVAKLDGHPVPPASAVLGYGSRVHTLLSTLCVMPFYLKSPQEMLQLCVDTLDHELYTQVVQRPPGSDYVYLVFDSPASLNSCALEAMLQHTHHYLGMPADRMLVADTFLSLSEQPAVVVGYSPRLLYALNTMQWCAYHGCKALTNADLELAYTPAVHHIACIMDWHGTDKTRMVIPVFGAMHALLGGDPMRLTRDDQYRPFKRSIGLLLTLMTNPACVAGRTDITSAFMQDLVIMLLNPLQPCIVHAENIPALKQLLSAEHLLLFQDCDETFAQEIVNLEPVLDEDRVAGLATRRTVFFANDSAFNGPAGMQWHSLTIAQRDAVIDTVVRYMVKTENGLDKGWQLLSYLAIVLPCTARYANQLFPRQAENKGVSLTARVISLERRTEMYPHHIPTTTTTTTTTVSAAAASAVDVSKVISDIQNVMNTVKQASKNTGAFVELRRAMLAALVIAFGYFDTLREQSIDENVHWTNNSVLRWLDDAIVNPKAAFAVSADMAPYLLYTSFFVPCTPDTATPFATQTLSLVERYSRNMLSVCRDSLLKVVRTTRPHPASYPAGSPTAAPVLTMPPQPATTTFSFRKRVRSEYSPVREDDEEDDRSNRSRH